jgi:hypothetical protein
MGLVETTDHHQVRAFLDAHGGRPMVAAGTAEADGTDGVGVLKIEFGDAHDESLVPLSWNEFFDRFERARLALVHDDELPGDRAAASARIVGRHED